MFTDANLTGLNFVMTESSDWMWDTYADPGVFKSICSSHSLSWIDGQHLVDQVFGLWSHRVPLRRRELFKE